MALDKYSILAKLNNYVERNPGIEKKMKHELKRKVERNGSQMVDEVAMVELGTEYLGIARQIAYQKGVPQSVIDAMDTYYCGFPSNIVADEHGYIRVTCPVMIDNDYALRRESLEIPPSKGGGRTGQGIDNIVKLFNNGYDANNYVYGIWEPRYPLYGDKKYGVRSVKSRPGLHFMQEAADEFEDRMSKTKRANVIYGFVNFKYSGEWD